MRDIRVSSGNLWGRAPPGKGREQGLRAEWSEQEEKNRDEQSLTT
jgi:hypothetical protein